MARVLIQAPPSLTRALRKLRHGGLVESTGEMAARFGAGPASAWPAYNVEHHILTKPGRHRADGGDAGFGADLEEVWARGYVSVRVRPYHARRSSARPSAIAAFSIAP
jgi:hypothetical protein